MNMSELFDLTALCRFLAGVEPAFADPAGVTLQPFSGGVSNLTALLRSGDRKLVVRRAPPGKKAATAHDMVREARVLTAVRPHFPLVPRVITVGEDPVILGTPFFVMEFLEGRTIGRDLPEPVSPRQARTLCERLVDLHADLHGIDLESTGLASLGRAEGYVKRQIEGWAERYRAARTDDVPRCERIIAWLEEQMPAEAGGCLVHNDFKFDNVVVAPDDVTRIVGILDWEMATVGDPLMDLGASLAYWVQRDDPTTLQAIRTQPTTVPGMMTRSEVVAHYAARTGREIGDFTYYYVYGLLRLAAIAQQIYARFKLGQTSDQRVASFGKAVTILADQAQRVIREWEAERSRPARMAALATDRAFRLDGKVAVITGSSRGIGEAIARLFANQGAHVVVTSRKLESCENVAQSIRDGGGKATARVCHVGDAGQRRALIDGVVEELGRIDILVNNAATNPYFGHILDTPDSMLAKTVEVNLAGFFHLCQLAGRAMREQGGGVIINTASVNGVDPAPLQGIYSVTKAAIISMTRAFAKECAAFGIRVNAVLPGITDTKFASALTRDEAMLRTILPMVPLGRVADPAEIAPAFLYLASDAGAYVTGACLTVDGGMLA
jgi:aminoglycoside phosphotransferase (APT) family kinase protein/NAD(P)-dependent dehydrogenase (short-subunit alcohol dehydrogenase family)